MGWPPSFALASKGEQPCTRARTQTSTHACTHAHTHACTHISMQARKHACTNRCTDACKHACTQACTAHARKQTCKHLSMQTCTHASKSTYKHASKQTCKHASTYGKHACMHAWQAHISSWLRKGCVRHTRSNNNSMLVNPDPTSTGYHGIEACHGTKVTIPIHRGACCADQSERARRSSQPGQHSFLAKHSLV